MVKKELSIYDELGVERKKLQEEGLLPEWVTTASWQMLKEKYITDKYPDLKAVFTRISKQASKYTPNPEEWEPKFFELFWKGWLAGSTPVISNMGTGHGCSVSCSGQYIGDSIHSFYANQVETAVLSKNGFGTSGYLGNIRPRGSKITGVKGSASGVLPVFKDFVQVSRDVSQGSQRRGAWAGYLEIDHPDFYEILNYVMKNPDDANVGWIVTDKFIERLDSGDNDAIERYQKAMKLKMISGKGYWFFVDKVNRLNPQMYKDKGLKVHASQLCVAPETKILTDRGCVTIKDWEDKYINVWNGENYSLVQIKKTGTNQELYRITTDYGYELICTPYHRFNVLDSDNNEVKVEAKDLTKETKITEYLLPTVTAGYKELDYAYLNGYFFGNGIEVIENNKLVKRVYLSNEKVIEEFRKVSKQTVDSSGTICFENYVLQSEMPNVEYTLESRVGWLEGLIDALGEISTYKSEQILTISDSRKPLSFFKELQEMLQELGVISQLGKHNIKIYALGINKLIMLGLLPRVIKLVEYRGETYPRNISIASVEKLDRTDDTYCFSEPKREMGVFNGILTYNCSEITLYNDEEYTYSCVLSSMNCSKYDEWKDTDAIFNATVFLDCVNQDLIEIGKNIEGMEKVVKFAIESRALGLGLLGFHTYLQDNMIPFESIDAMYKNTEIFKLLNSESKRASEWMAKEWGEPEWCKGYGVRNTHRLAVAPNLCMTEDTKILSKTGYPISYKDLLLSLGINFDALEEVSLHLSDFRILTPKYYEYFSVARGEEYLEIMACDIEVGDVIISCRAKVVDIKDKQKMWIETNTKCEVKTPLGSQAVNRIWFNGFEIVHKLFFRNKKNDIYTVKCTPDHKFLTTDGDWIAAKDMVPGYEFQNGYVYETTIISENRQLTLDIEVPEEHCFYLESGIISHNTSSIICGAVSQGIEPIYKNAYTQNTAAGKMNRVNPSLLRLMKEKGVYSDQTINDIIANNGSVQHVTWLTEDEKQVFKTAFEIDQKHIIRLASSRQRFIDQAQSINLFFSANESEEYISEVHKMAFKDPYIKSLYYIRSERGVKVSKNECVACEG